MKDQFETRNRQNSDFNKLLARCMATALFSFGTKKDKHQLTLHDQHYQETINRLERDILLDEENEQLKR